jgi:hypothetical protein
VIGFWGLGDIYHTSGTRLWFNSIWETGNISVRKGNILRLGPRTNLAAIQNNRERRDVVLFGLP